MVTKNLARAFESSPPLAFLGIIEDAGGPIRTVAIKKLLIDSGAPKAAVDGRWETFKKYILDHPNVERGGTAAYVWRGSPVSASDALRRLAGYAGKKSCPDWLSKALVSVVEGRLATRPAGLVEETAPLTFRRVADAAVLAKIVAHVEEMAYGGASSDAIVKWCQEQAQESRLRDIGQVGETTRFDSAVHTAASGYPERGETVLVIRPGYEWLGGDEPVLVQRALVAQR